MITVKLKNTLFQSPNGLFFREGIPRNRAVLHIGAGRNDLPLGKLSTGTAANLAYRGNQCVLLVDSTGTTFEDIVLETIMQNENYRPAYGVQLLDFVERDYVEVTQDGTPITATALRTYTAP